MRFRGTLAKDALAVLLDAALAFSRLSPAAGASPCVVTLSPDALALALKAAGDELQSFARLPLARLFLDVVLQSQADNHIAFSCDVRLLQRALASGRDASAVMLRLLKRDGRSFLCLRTRAVDVEIVQSVPVKVLPMSEAALFQEPNVPAPQVVMELPPLRALRTVVERLKAVHKTVALEASRRGTLALRVDSLALTLQTLFARLRFRDDLVDGGDGRGDGEEEEEEADARRAGAADASSVTVDAKVLAKALAMDCASVDSVLCCISEDRALVLHAILAGGFGSLTCYLPVLTPGE